MGVILDHGLFRVARLVLHPSSTPHLPHPNPLQGSIAELSKAIFLIDDRAVNPASCLIFPPLDHSPVLDSFNRSPTLCGVRPVIISTQHALWTFMTRFH